MTRGSLRLRLLLAGALSVILALAVSSLALVMLFERHVERRIVAELAVHLDQILAGLELDEDGVLHVARTPADPRFSEPLSGLYWQIEAGSRRLRSRSLWDSTLQLPADVLADGSTHQHVIEGPGDRALIALERSVVLPATLGGGTATSVAAIDAGEVTVARRAFTADLLAYMALLALALIAAAYLQVHVGLKPLAAVRARLSSIRAGTARRLGRDFPDEILPLAEETDALLAAREAQIARARTKAAELAHGLKTPLQVLAGDIERLRGQGNESIAAEIAEVASAMRRHVDRQLVGARIAAANPDSCADIAEVTRQIVAVVARTPVAAALEWTIEVPDHLRARIDVKDLAEALGNLIENAARHAKTRVTVGTRRGRGTVVIAVTDDGPGMPERIGESLPDPDTRPGDGGEGTGLGLAIVEDIAEAWGARFALRSDDTGTTAELEIDVWRPDNPHKGLTM